jgi:hypothetical protein
VDLVQGGLGTGRPDPGQAVGDAPGGGDEEVPRPTESRILPLNGSMISTMRRTIGVGVKYSPPLEPSAIANLPRKYS